jgi:hypothetical protein
MKDASAGRSPPSSAWSFTRTLGATHPVVEPRIERVPFTPEVVHVLG